MTDIILHHYEISPYSEKVRLGLGLKGLAWAIGRDPRHHAETRSDGADRRLSQDARAANRRRHLLRQSTDHARAGAPISEPELLSGRSRRGGCACVVGGKDDVQPGGRNRFRQEAGRVARGVSRRPRQILRPKYRSGRNDGGSAVSARSVARAFRLARSDAGRRALVLAGRGRRPRRSRGLPPDLVLAAEFRTGGSTARRISKATELGRARRRHWPRRPAPHDRHRRRLRSQAPPRRPPAQPPIRDDPIGRQPGQRVTVTPDDTGRDPVVGELVASGVDEIIIKRYDPAVGEVCVHFPRAGFVVASTL